MSLKAVVTLPSVSVSEKDDVTNTFTIGGTISEEDVTIGMELAIHDAFANFYNVAPPGAVPANSIAAYLSAVLDRGANACRLDLYDTTAKLSGEPTGSPFSSTLFTLAAASEATALPSEVALCVTMEAIGRADAPAEAPDGLDAGVALDRPRQRFTGRIYLGPLIRGASVIVGGIARPAANLTDVARRSMGRLDTDIRTATGDASWLGIWSRADAMIRQLDAVSTDDAFDTQRRRGESPTARTRLVV